MSNNQCLVCNLDADGQLQCSVCKYHLHYVCVLGLDPPEDFKASGEKHKYVCPPCLVGTSYDLLHLAIDAHSRNAAAGSIKINVPSARGRRAERRASARDNVNGGMVVADPPLPTPDRVSVQGSDELGGDSADLSPLHEADIARSNRLSFILNTFKNLPDHVTTLILGDSNTHKIRGNDLDPKGNKVCVRSFGGLCIYATVHALKNYEHEYSNIRKVAWSLGANDALHGEDQHCLDDYPHHVQALYTETKRVFPNSTVHFILPFSGIKAVTPAFRSSLQALLKEHAPEIKMHNPPNMSGKMMRDGVHINQAGKEAYVNFLMKKFTKNKPQPKQASVSDHPQGQPQPNTSTGSGHQQGHQVGHGNEGFRLHHPQLSPTFAPSHVQYYNGAPASYQAGPQHLQYQQYPVLQQPGLAEALSQTMQRWWSSQQPRYVNSGPIQSWPP